MAHVCIPGVAAKRIVKLRISSAQWICMLGIRVWQIFKQFLIYYIFVDAARILIWGCLLWDAPSRGFGKKGSACERNFIFKGND